MRYLVISDIHANLDALEAVLLAAAPLEWDRVLVLGDLVGYGAEPNAVVDRIKGLDPIAMVRGNHDKVAAGHEDAEAFNPVARRGAMWTAEHLTPENRAYLGELPEGPQFVGEGVEICHGTPFDEDSYVFDELDALQALQAVKRPVCLYGHTHFPLAHRLRGRGLDPLPLLGDAEEVLALDLSGDARYLINVGSVGQPRDGDPRAAFGVLDTERSDITLCRVEYPVERAQQRILAAGLPEALAHRLAIGR
jgi:diadenosine tetraphosphatase ApaH/serine/threonine PP2A family protein phosphatase